MRCFSSSATVWYKRIFPIFWFGFLGVFFLFNLYALLTGRFGDSLGSLPMLVVPIAMAIFGYYFMQKFVFDLVDEVEDAGDALIVKNGARSERIALSDIVNVNYSPMMNPPRVTLVLRKAGVFGDQVSFCAPIQLMPFGSHPSIEGLIRRIDASRNASRRH